MNGGCRGNGRRRALLASCLAWGVLGCAEDATGPTGSAAFRVVVSGEAFVVRVEGAEEVAAMEARLASGVEGVISGDLIEGDGGYNGPWSWHLDPASVHVPDLAIELCDGRPSMVEEDLEYWLESVGQFCPWGAKVVERLEG